MKKYSRLSSAAVVIGTLRVNRFVAILEQEPTLLVQYFSYAKTSLFFNYLKENLY